MAPLLHELQRRGEHIETALCLTAQHREIVDQVLEHFQLAPHTDLNLMRPNQDLTDLSMRLLDGMRSFLTDFRPDVLLVHGDTTTTLMASLAAFYHQIPVGHVEAGLRTGDIYDPFPEEMNRRICDAISAVYYAPTERNRRSLLAEGVADEDIVLTGNTAIDALQWTVNRDRGDEASIFPAGKRGLLVTMHRREKFGEGIAAIGRALARLAAARDDLHVVFPVHPNPNVRGPVEAVLGGIDNVDLVAPSDYPTFVRWMRQAHLILTDSGGIQEEAPSLGKPVLVLRDCTERQEAIEAGTVELVGTDPEAIVAAALRLLEDDDAYQAMAHASNPYGDGRASVRIVDDLEQRFATPAARSDIRNAPAAPVELEKP